MIFCETELCIYNQDSYCSLDYIEIGSLGECYQRMTLSIPDETLEFVPKEALDLIKKEHVKNEKELWDKRLQKK